MTKTYNKRKQTRARPLGEILAGNFSDVIAQRSGMTLDLINAWEDIAGEDFYACTWPEKILWPRHASDGANRFDVGTLVLACEGAKAVFLQHQNQEIIDRLNRFFGFEAITRIKIVQKPIPRRDRQKTKQRPLDEAEEQRLQTLLEAIEKGELRDRLEKLGRGVIRRNVSADNFCPNNRRN